MAADAPTSYPVQLSLDAPPTLARWRPLLHWLLAIPHYVVLYVLRLVYGVVLFISLFSILFTVEIPPAFFGFMAAYYRYQWRVTSYIFWMRDSYPPFELATTGLDTETDPARLSIQEPEKLSRLLIFVKWLLAVPHYIVLIFVGIAAFFVGILSFFVVLVTGAWPEGMRDFLVGANRWRTRVNAYVTLLTDVYPPLSLAP